MIERQSNSLVSRCNFFPAKSVGPLATFLLSAHSIFRKTCLHLRLSFINTSHGSIGRFSRCLSNSMSFLHLKLNFKLSIFSINALCLRCRFALIMKIVPIVILHNMVKTQLPLLKIHLCRLLLISHSAPPLYDALALFELKVTQL